VIESGEELSRDRRRDCICQKDSSIVTIQYKMMDMKLRAYEGELVCMKQELVGCKALKE
jgi:hypothetical protein